MRWEVQTIEAVCKVVNGGTPKSKEPSFWGGHVQWVTPKDLGKLKGRFISGSSRQLTELGLNSSSAQLTPPNSVILSTRAPIGHLAISTVEIAVNQGCRILVPKNNLDAQFLFFYLLGRKKELISLGTGTTFLELGAKALKGFSMPVPPMEEQERIVEILDQAFEAIDKAKANITRNLANARELFQSRLNEIFSNPPADWEVKPLGEVCDLENGDRGKNYPKPTDLADNGVPWVNAGDLSEGFCEVTTANHITTGAYERLSRGKFKGGDVLFCLRGSLGKHGQVRSGDFGAIASSLIIIKTSSYLDSCFLNHWLNCGFCKTQIDKYAGGAAQPNLGGKDLGRFHFPVPSQAEKATIVDHLEKLEQQVKGLKMNYQSQLNNLEELRQSILEQAFEGKLTEPIAL